MRRNVCKSRFVKYQKNLNVYKHYGLQIMNSSKIEIPIALKELASGFSSMTVTTSGGKAIQDFSGFLRI